ncbi:MAG TPA: hypothetical protein VL984_10955 [Acidimicrobiales bacterium]|nr:hypothetical protein [Acidimicrobiales bacterium]
MNLCAGEQRRGAAGSACHQGSQKYGRAQEDEGYYAGRPAGVPQVDLGHQLAPEVVVATEVVVVGTMIVLVVLVVLVVSEVVLVVAEVARDFGDVVDEEAVAAIAVVVVATCAPAVTLPGSSAAATAPTVAVPMVANKAIAALVRRIRRFTRARAKLLPVRAAPAPSVCFLITFLSWSGAIGGAKCKACPSSLALFIER